MSFVDFKIARIATNLGTFRISFTPPLSLFWQLQRWWRSSWSPPLTLTCRALHLQRPLQLKKGWVRREINWGQLALTKGTAGFAPNPATSAHKKPQFCNFWGMVWARHASRDISVPTLMRTPWQLASEVRLSDVWCQWLRILFLWSVNDHYGSKRSWPCSQGQALH